MEVSQNHSIREVITYFGFLLKQAEINIESHKRVFDTYYVPILQAYFHHTKDPQAEDKVIKTILILIRKGMDNTNNFYKYLWNIREIVLKTVIDSGYDPLMGILQWTLEGTIFDKHSYLRKDEKKFLKDLRTRFQRSKTKSQILELVNLTLQKQHNPSQSITISTLELLHKFNLYDSIVLDLSIKALDSINREYWNLKIDILRILGDFRDPRVVNPIVKCLHDPELQVQLEAVKTITSGKCASLQAAINASVMNGGTIQSIQRRKEREDEINKKEKDIDRDNEHRLWCDHCKKSVRGSVFFSPGSISWKASTDKCPTCNGSLIEIKTCSNCKSHLPLSTGVGEKCPFCGVQFSYSQ